jgi:hypothetical protein
MVETMTPQAPLQIRRPEVSLRAEVIAFASTLALQSVTFYLFILLSFVVLHRPEQEPRAAQAVRDAPALQSRALPRAPAGEGLGHDPDLPPATAPAHAPR